MQQMQATGQISPQEAQQQMQVDVEAKVAQYIAQYTEEVMAVLLPPPAGEIDPLVQLRDKELDIKALDMQRKADEFSSKQAFEEQREAERQDLTREKMDSQEDIALLRADVNLERIGEMGSAGRGE